MCYKKPGPRCSKTARTQLRVANRHLTELLGKPVRLNEQILDAMRDKKDAQIQYDMTPEGQKKLQEAIDAGKDSSGDLVLRLEQGVTRRKNALKELKEPDKGDVVHSTKKLKTLDENLKSHAARMKEWDEKSRDLELSSDFDEIPTSQWHKRKTIVFDLETTGVDTSTARIVTASVLEIYGDPSNPDKMVVREWLVDPGVDIPQASSDVHGVSNDRAANEGIDPSTAIKELNSIIAKESERGVPVIGYNVGYDFSVLANETRRNKMEPLENESLLIIDPLTIDRAKEKFIQGDRKLTSQAQRYGLGEFDAHNSSADCIMTAKIAVAMAEKYPEILVEPETLTSQQRAWKKRWADGMNEWLEGKGRVPDVNPELAAS